VVAVAVSGGVDSAVAALLLQQQGYRVFGVFMNNWDAADEAGAGAATCSSAADLADARALCDALGMPLYEADFVARYWNDVFDGFLHGLSQGLTPNPDLACNSHIKFGALLRFARDRGADLLATGHYARLAWAPVQDAAAAGAASAGAAGAAADTTADADAAAPDAAAGWQPLLLTGSDPAKDQSYFLAAVSQQQLRHVMFPVGACLCVCLCVCSVCPLSAWHCPLRPWRTPRHVLQPSPSLHRSCTPRPPHKGRHPAAGSTGGAAAGRQAQQRRHLLHWPPQLWSLP
jgi:tRNA-specific 2-thiouridylase